MIGPRCPIRLGQPLTQPGFLTAEQSPMANRIAIDYLQRCVQETQGDTPAQPYLGARYMPSAVIIRIRRPRDCEYEPPGACRFHTSFVENSLRLAAERLASRRPQGRSFCPSSHGSDRCKPVRVLHRRSLRILHSRATAYGLRASPSACLGRGYRHVSSIISGACVPS